MATAPAPNPPADSPTAAPNVPSSLKAEYEAAVAAHKHQLTSMGPTRKQYDALFQQHKQIQARFDRLTAEIRSHLTAYQRHKQHVVSLSRALLASNTALSSAPKPFSDVQALTQATLLNELRLASYTFINMIIQNKRLDDAKERDFTLDQEFYARCRELFKVVDKDCRELDRLHAKVLEAEKKIGGKSGCGAADERCISCMRNGEREAKRVAAEKVLKGGGGGGGGGGGKVRGGMGKAAQGKQRMDEILEDGELRMGS